VQGCYLLHFDRPIYRAQHYLGWATNIDRRVAQHSRGKGARLVAQALAAGISVDLVRVWPEVDRAEERSLKRRGPKGQCPRCQPNKRAGKSRTALTLRVE
jgi:predicted GIY-YIG superfamily endonuclease